MNEIFEYDVFLSFASEDEDIVKPFWQNLSLSGLRVFWSNVTLKEKVGNNWFDIIQHAVVNSRHFILVCTQNSMSSEFVKVEYQTFHNLCSLKSKGQRLLILKMDRNFKISSLPPFLQNLHAATSDEEIIKKLGGSNLEELKLKIKELKETIEELEKKNIELSKENEELKKKNQILFNENEILKKSTKTNPVKSEPNNQNKILTDNQKKVYLIEHAKLFDKPNGKRIGSQFKIGHEFEFSEINERGWCLIKTDNKKLWIPPSLFEYDDPRTYFEIIENKLQGYLIGETQGNKLVGSLDYIKIMDNTLGIIEIEIKKILSISTTYDSESSAVIKIIDGSSFNGKFKPKGYYGSELNTYLISSFSTIQIHKTKNITLKRST